MKDAVEITDEIRQAVHREDCERLGHQLNISNAFKARAAMNTGGLELAAMDETELPHVLCDRCGAAWIVLPAPGADYAAAEEAVIELLPEDAELARQITRNRTRRAKLAQLKAQH